MAAGNLADVSWIVSSMVAREPSIILVHMLGSHSVVDADDDGA